MKLIKNIINRLFGGRWICEYCYDVIKSHTQPYCKACCHVYKGNVKMLRIKND